MNTTIPTVRVCAIHSANESLFFIDAHLVGVVWLKHLAKLNVFVSFMFIISKRKTSQSDSDDLDRDAIFNKVTYD